MSTPSRVLRTSICVVASALVMSCTGERPLGEDASVALDAPSTPEGPMPPLPIGPVVCPDGWVRHESAGVATCEPWDGPRPTCEPGSMALPGRACAPVGTPCPADGWPALVPEGARYVRPGAPEPRDGTREHPYDDISDAISVTRDGDTIALSVGEHSFRDSAVGSRIYLGACTEGTIIDSRGGQRVAFFGLPGTRPRVATFRDLTMRGAPSATTSEVYTVDVGNVGSSATLERVRISPDSFRSLHFTRGGEIIVRDSLLEGSDGIAGFGAFSLTIERSVIQGVRGNATLYVDDPPGAADAPQPGPVRLRVSDSVIIGTALGDIRDQVGADGALPALDAVFERVYVEDAYAVAFLANGPATTVSLSDVVVRRVSPGTAEGRTDAVAMFALRGASLRLARVLVDGSENRGIEVLGGSRLDAEDLVIRGVRGAGTALGLGERSTGEAHRVAVERCATTLGAGTSGEAMLTITDVVIRDLEQPTPPYAAHGIGGGEGGVTHVERALVERVPGSGILVTGGTVEAADVEVRHIAQSEGEVGIGAVVLSAVESPPAVLHLTRARIDELASWGVYVAGPQSTAELTDTQIHRARRSSEGTPGETVGDGSGIACGEGAMLTARRFVLAECDSSGMVHTTSCGGYLAYGRIERNPFGLVTAGGVPGDAGVVLDHVFVEDMPQLPFAAVSAPAIEAPRLSTPEITSPRP